MILVCKTFYKLEQFKASAGKKINFKLATNYWLRAIKLN